MRLRTVLLCFAVFCACMFVLAAEIWIYALSGMSSAKATSLGGFLLIALMVLTGAVGVLVPVVSMIGAVTKKREGKYFLFLPFPPFIFTGEHKKQAAGRRR